MEREVTGYGTYNMPPGSWSDDSTMTLCLVKNILEYGTPTDLMKKFQNWYQDGYMTPTGELFDIGNTTRVAIERFMRNMAEKPKYGVQLLKKKMEMVRSCGLCHWLS